MWPYWLLFLKLKHVLFTFKCQKSAYLESFLIDLSTSNCNFISRIICSLILYQLDSLLADCLPGTLCYYPKFCSSKHLTRFLMKYVYEIILFLLKNFFSRLKLFSKVALNIETALKKLKNMIIDHRSSSDAPVFWIDQNNCDFLTSIWRLRIVV